MEKQSWVTPELIIISRSRPEEMVLRWCKSDKINQTSSIDEKCTELSNKQCSTCYGFGDS
jgi:hypothetical protein